MGKNSKCKYYPCHIDMDDCAYCYCPIFPCGIIELGKLLEKIPDNGKEKSFIWDCSSCNILHKKENIDEIKKFIFEFVTNISKRQAANQPKGEKEE